MADNAWPWQKIIRMRNTSYAVLDELAYYREIYATSGSLPNPGFYGITSPFRMDSEVAAEIARKSAVDGRKQKRKRRRLAISNISDKLQETGARLRSVLKKAVTSGAFEDELCTAGSNTPADCSNRQARELADKVASVPCVFSCYEEHPCLAGRKITEIHLDRQNRNVDNIPSGVILWINREPNVLIVSCKGEEYVLPPFSSFIADDARVSRTLVTQGKRFDFILLDPPWPNRSVKRKSTYTTHDKVELLLDLYIQELLKESGLLAFWVTNSPGILHFVDEFIERHEFEKVATWRWLKVTRTGEPVYSLESKHKQPFESVIFVCNNNLEFYREKIVDEFVLISTPSAIHSRKPPLLPVLQALGILEHSAEQLELYGRYLLPRTTTVGFEAPRLQNKRFFV